MEHSPYGGTSNPHAPFEGAGSLPPIGSGEAISIYAAVVPGQQVQLTKGTPAAPDTTSGPLLKVQRTQQLTKAAIEAIGGAGTDGGEQLAAIFGISAGTAASEVQAVGVYGAAKTSSNTGAPGNDACGLYGVGRALEGSTGHSFGGFMLGRREATGGATGAEIDVYNGGAAGVYNPAGATLTKALSLAPLGAANSGVAIQIGNSFGRQFEHGLAFNGQVEGGLTGAIAGSAIRDDSTSTRSIDIRSTHATAAISIAGASGPVLIGQAAAAGVPAQLSAGSLLELQAIANTVVDPIFRISSTTASGLSQRIINASGSMILGLSGGPNQFATGSIAGDIAIRIGAAGARLFLAEVGGAPMVTVNTTGVAVNGNAPVAKAGAIASPAAEAAALKTAVDALRVAVQAFGITA